jgi:AcrR family transcriptional regulator
MSPSSDAAPVVSRGRPRSFDRQVALDQAMHVFWKKGYAGASLSDLTAAMGIASPSLYAAFGSKEGLYREALDHYAAIFSAEFSLLMAAPTARESIEGLLRMAVHSFGASKAASGCMIMQSAAETAEVSADLAASLCELRASGARTFADRLRRGLDEGDIAPGTDIRAVADFYATVHKGLSLSASGGADRAELDSVVTSAMAAWDPLTGQTTSTQA